MSLVKTWYTPEAAADKFGIKSEQLLEWVAEGLVRAEMEEEKIVQVNIDDEAYGSGMGTSKQSAEKAAAKEALQNLGVLELN